MPPSKTKSSSTARITSAKHRGRTRSKMSPSGTRDSSPMPISDTGSDDKPLLPCPPIGRGTMVPKYDWKTEKALSNWVELLTILLRPYATCKRCKKHQRGLVWTKDVSLGVRFWSHVCNVRGQPKNKEKWHWREFLFHVIPTLTETEKYKTYVLPHEHNLAEWIAYAHQQAPILRREKKNRALAANVFKKQGLPVPDALVDLINDNPLTPTQSAAGAGAAARPVLGDISNTSSVTLFNREDSPLFGGQGGSPIPKHVVPSSQHVQDADTGTDPIWRGLTFNEPDWEEAPNLTSPLDPVPIYSEDDDDISTEGEEGPDTSWYTQARALQSIAEVKLGGFPDLAWWSGVCNAKPSELCAELHTLGFDTSKILHLGHVAGGGCGVAMIILEPGGLGLFQMRARYLGLDRVVSSPMAFSVVPPYQAVFGTNNPTGPPPNQAELVAARAKFLLDLKGLRLQHAEKGREAVAAAFLAREHELTYYWHDPASATVRA
ncbi:unnamed protein product [Tilletia controversa]|nr:unnamed protein product [Tilletia controversa]CAD6934011.1 unnamed protein product [Tilletia controversa]